MLMSIFWLQQTMADVPTNNAWLCANEEHRLNGMKFAKRRNDWRLGRWTAKCAIAAHLGWRTESSFLVDIEICPAASGAPEAFIAQQRTSLGVSLSHCAGRAIAALVPSGVMVGCDLERIELRISAFVSDYFTPEEQLWVAEMPAPYRPALVTLLWSAKESALKALGQGLRLDTRSVSVKIGDPQGIPGHLAACFQTASRQEIQHPPGEPGQAGWRPLQVVCSNGGRTFNGWWQATSGFVRTLVAGAPLAPPILLDSRLQGGE
jgi:4'-phosphopantetheinyl transferase